MLPLPPCRSMIPLPNCVPSIADYYCHHGVHGRELTLVDARQACSWPEDQEDTYYLTLAGEYGLRTDVLSGDTIPQLATRSPQGHPPLSIRGGTYLPCHTPGHTFPDPSTLNGPSTGTASGNDLFSVRPTKRHASRRDSVLLPKISDT